MKKAIFERRLDALVEEARGPLGTSELRAALRRAMQGVQNPPEKKYNISGDEHESPAYRLKRDGVTFRNTGIKRCPRKGEFYLSGARAAVWIAPRDLNQAFYIAVEIEF